MASVKTLTGGASASVGEIIKIVLFVVVLIGSIILLLPIFTKMFATLAVNTATDAVKSVVTAPVVAAKEIVTRKEESMTIAAKREQAYAEFYGDAGVPVKTALFLGNLITPESVLVSQTIAGADFRTQLIADGREDDYEALGGTSKGLVTMGEALGSAVGWSPYEAGKDFRSWLDRR